jgi:YVTN family beta-propeller protein
MGGIRVRTQSGSSLLEVCVALAILTFVFPTLMLFLFTVMKTNATVPLVAEANLLQREAESFVAINLDLSTPPSSPISGSSSTTTLPGGPTTTVAPVNYLPCSADLITKIQDRLNYDFPAGGPVTVEIKSVQSKKLSSSPAGIGLYTASPNNDLWVTDAGANTVQRYTLGTPPNPADPTNRFVKSITVGTTPLGVTTGAGSVWVSNFGSDTLSRINTTSNTVQATRAVGDGPQGLAFGNSAVWVANSLADTVTRFNPSNNTASLPITVGDDPRSVAFDGTNVWVTNFAGNSVSKISPANNTVTATVAVGEKPQGVTFGAGSIWVANSENDYVSRIAPATNQVTATISVGDSPQGVSFDGTSVWVANFGSDNLSKITPASNSVTATVPVGVDPISITSGTGTVGTWVPSSVGGKVTKLNSAGAIDSSESFANIDLSLGSCLTAADDTGLQLWTVKVITGESSRVLQLLKEAS